MSSVPRMVTSRGTRRWQTLPVNSMRFTSGSTQALSVPVDAAADNATAITVIVGVTRLVTTGEILAAKRSAISTGTEPGWSVNIVSGLGQLRIVWQRATTNLQYVTTSTGPLNHIRDPFWCVWTADQNGTASAKVIMYWARLGGVLQRLTNTTTTDGSGAFGSDAGVNVGLGNANNPAGGGGMSSEMWRSIVLPRVLAPRQIADIIDDPWTLVPGAIVDVFPGESKFGAQNYGIGRKRASIVGSPIVVPGPYLISTKMLEPVNKAGVVGTLVRPRSVATSRQHFDLALRRRQRVLAERQMYGGMGGVTLPLVPTPAAGGGGSATLLLSPRALYVTNGVA